MKIFLSYHTPDRTRIDELQSAIESRMTDASIFVDHQSLKYGQFWQPALYDAIADADAFITIIGNTIGDWQRAEYYAANDRKQKEGDAFVLLPIIVANRELGTAPNLPGLSQLHWIETTDPSAPRPLDKIIGALSGEGVDQPLEAWQTFNPFRGLTALEEQDSEFFFGRDSETEQVIENIEQKPDRLITLVGNSGVGKSSLVQAGVIASLKRRDGSPEQTIGKQQTSNWNNWAFITFKPDDDPIKALVTEFMSLWFDSVTDPERIKQRNSWIALLKNGDASIGDLIDATESRLEKELSLVPPAGILIYVDQGEEMYSRCTDEVSEVFSRILLEPLEDTRFICLLSLRSDYYGNLQADNRLFPRACIVDISPLNSDDLRAVVKGPTKLLGAKFESPYVVTHLVEQASRQPGALPLLADLLTDLWNQMQNREDGCLRLFGEANTVHLDMMLTRRADAYIHENPKLAKTVQRLFTQKLCSMRYDGEPVRRRLTKTECTSEEWSIMEELAEAKWRLTVISASEGISTAEVAHEILLKKWITLQRWLKEGRDFLTWKSDSERQLQRFVSAPPRDQKGMLLDSWLLKMARHHLKQGKYEISKELLKFIDTSEFHGLLLKLTGCIVAFHFMIMIVRATDLTYTDFENMSEFAYMVLAVTFFSTVGSIYFATKAFALMRVSFTLVSLIILFSFIGAVFLEDEFVYELGINEQLKVAKSWIYQLSSDPEAFRYLMIRSADWILVSIALTAVSILYFFPRFDATERNLKRLIVGIGSVTIAIIAICIGLYLLDNLPAEQRPKLDSHPPIDLLNHEFDDTSKPSLRQSIVGAWIVKSDGNSCQIFLALTKWQSGYLAALPECNMPEIKSIEAWDERNGNILLIGPLGSSLAELSKVSEELILGATASGLPLSLSR